MIEKMRVFSKFVVGPSALALVLAGFASTVGCSGSSSSSEPPADSGTPSTDGGADAPTADGGACPATGSGTLQVTVSGLPAGLDAKITVEGATAPVTSTTSLSLTGGTHAVSASIVTSSDPIVRSAYRPTVSAASVCVGSEAASVTIAYEKIASSDALWLTHGNGTGEIASIAGDGLDATGSVTASGFDVGVPAAASLAFDKDGNLWISAGSGEVRRFPAAVLGSAGQKTPDVTLVSAEFSAGLPGPGPIALDKSGDLWIGLVAQKKIVKIPAATAIAGTATPTVTLEGDALEAMGAIAFDASGNLFVAANDRVLRYDAAHIASSSSAAPELSIEAKTPGPSINTLTTPSGLAFDKSGNLWVAYFAANAIARLTSAETSAAGTTTVTPAVLLKITVSAIVEEIAFDESGGLWLTYQSGKVARLGPTQLVATSDEIEPSTIVTATGLGGAKGVALFPAPAGLPLASSLP